MLYIQVTRLGCQYMEDMHVDYDAALLVVQSSTARKYGDLLSWTKPLIKDVQQLCIASNS